MSVVNAGYRLRDGAAVRFGLAGAVSLFTGAAVAEYIVPIAAHSPQALITLTTERAVDDTDFSINNKNTVGSNTLPLGGTPHYEIVTYDTGAGVHLLSRDAYNAFDIGGAGRDGAFPTLVNGVEAIASDPLGIYAGGFGTATATSPNLAADTTTFRGQTNTSVLYAPAGNQTLPSVLGTPLASQYTSVFDYGNPQILEVDGREFRSPALSINNFGTLPEVTRRLELEVATGLLGDPPSFFPSLLDFNDFGNDPAAPTVGPSFFLDGDVGHDGNARSQLRFIFDTGSQATFVSEQVAATLGFDVALDDPDFVVRLQTVTGESDEVPGFIADTFTLPGIAGGLALTDVPLVVFNLPDPSSPGNLLDGLIGMNLFADRTVTLDPQPATQLGDPGPYLGLSDQALDNHDWAATTASANFNDAASWTGTGTPQLDWIAHVENNAGIDQIAFIEQDTQVSALNVVGDSERMLVTIGGGDTLTVFGTAIVMDNGALRLNGGNISALGVEVRDGGSLFGSGSVTGEVLSLGTIAPSGLGSSVGEPAVPSVGILEFEGNIDLLAQGEFNADIGGISNESFTQFDQLRGDQTITVAGTLNLLLFDSPGLPDFTLAVGDTVDIVTADTLLGTFGAVTGLINGDTMWTLDYGPTALTLEALLAGDLNGDGFVSQADLDLVLLNWGDTVTAGVAGLGDATGDGFISQGDLDLVLLNWGGGTPPVLSIPEPTTATLLVLGGLVALRRRL